MVVRSRAIAKLASRGDAVGPAGGRRERRGEMSRGFALASLGKNIRANLVVTAAPPLQYSFFFLPSPSIPPRPDRSPPFMQAWHASA